MWSKNFEVCASEHEGQTTFPAKSRRSVDYHHTIEAWVVVVDDSNSYA